MHCLQLDEDNDDEDNENENYDDEDNDKKKNVNEDNDDEGNTMKILFLEMIMLMIMLTRILIYLSQPPPGSVESLPVLRGHGFLHGVGLSCTVGSHQAPVCSVQRALQDRQTSEN